MATPCLPEDQTMTALHDSDDAIGGGNDGGGGVAPEADGQCEAEQKFLCAARALLDGHNAQVSSFVENGTMVTHGTKVFSLLDDAMAHAQRRGQGHFVFSWDNTCVVPDKRKGKESQLVLYMSKRYSVCCSYDHLFKLTDELPIHMRHFYEYLLHEDTPTCFFVDVDRTHPPRDADGKLPAEYEVYTDDALAQIFVKHIRIAFRKKMGASRGDIKDEHVRVLSASSPKKQSLHITIRAPHLVFPWGVARRFGEWLFAKQWSKGLALGGDLKVYMVRQQLRMPNSTKLGVDPTADAVDGAPVLAHLRPPRPCVPVPYNECPVDPDIRTYTLMWFDSPSPPLASMPAFQVEDRAKACGSGAGARVSTTKRTGHAGGYSHILHPKHTFTALRLMRSLHPDLEVFSHVLVPRHATPCVDGVYVIVDFDKSNAPCAITGEVHHINTANIHVAATTHSVLLDPKGSVVFYYHCFNASRHNPAAKLHRVVVEWDDVAKCAKLVTKNSKRGACEGDCDGAAGGDGKRTRV